MAELSAPLKSNCFSYSLGKHFENMLITQNRHFKFYHPIKLFAQERIFANNLDANCKNVENPARLNFPSINFNCFKSEKFLSLPS